MVNELEVEEHVQDHNWAEEHADAPLSGNILYRVS